MFKAWWDDHHAGRYGDEERLSFAVVIDGSKGYIKHIPCGTDVPCRAGERGGFNSSQLRKHLARCSSDAMDISLGEAEEETDGERLTDCLLRRPDILNNSNTLVEEQCLRCNHCSEKFKYYADRKSDGKVYFKLDKFANHSCSGWNTAAPTPVSSMVLDTDEGGLPSGGTATVSKFEKDGLYLEGLSSVVKRNHCLKWAGFDYRSATGNLELNLKAHVDSNDHTRSSRTPKITTMLKPLNPPLLLSDYTCPHTAALCFGYRTDDDDLRDVAKYSQHHDFDYDHCKFYPCRDMYTLTLVKNPEKVEKFEAVFRHKECQRRTNGSLKPFPSFTCDACSGALSDQRIKRLLEKRKKGPNPNRAIEDDQVDFISGRVRDYRATTQALHLQVLNLLRGLSRAKAPKAQPFGDANVDDILKYSKGRGESRI